MHHPVSPQIKKFFFMGIVWMVGNRFIREIDLGEVFIYYERVVGGY